MGVQEADKQEKIRHLEITELKSSHSKEIKMIEEYV